MIKEFQGVKKPHKDLQYQHKQAKTLLFCQAKWLSNTKQSLGICVSKLQKQKVLGLIITSRQSWLSIFAWGSTESGLPELILQGLESETHNLWILRWMSSIKQSFSSRITSRAGVTSVYHHAQDFYKSRGRHSEHQGMIHPPPTGSSTPDISHMAFFRPQLLLSEPPVALGLSESPCFAPSWLFSTSDEAASLGRIFLSSSICCFLSPTVRAVTSSPGHTAAHAWYGLQ